MWWIYTLPQASYFGADRYQCVDCYTLSSIARRRVKEVGFLSHFLKQIPKPVTATLDCCRNKI